MGYDLSRPTHSYSRKFQKPIMCPCFNHKAICVYIRRHIAVDGALLPPYLMVSSCLYKFGQGMYLCCIINVKCPKKQGHSVRLCLLWLWSQKLLDFLSGKLQLGLFERERAERHSQMLRHQLRQVCDLRFVFKYSFEFMPRIVTFL